jgi:ABC-2 type transport system ATP-binding protein
MSITISSVSKIYGEQIAVNQINIDIPKGQVVGFLGPNGAGKTTTMKMITGYLAPTSGSLQVCGLDVATNAMAIRKKIGYLPESNPQYDEMYVREYLEFLAQLHELGKASKHRIEEMISITGLSQEAHKKIGALSKGYKQRVGLAQAMLHNPEVLILDEPTSGLDPNQIVEIRNLITQFGQEKTVLLSTHIMQEVNAMCQRVIIINKGNVVADNSIDDLKAMHQSTSETILFQTKENIEAILFEKLAGVESITTVSPNTIRFATKNADALKKTILKHCIDLNIDWQNINTENNSLEDIFRQLTKS